MSSSQLSRYNDVLNKGGLVQHGQPGGAAQSIAEQAEANALASEEKAKRQRQYAANFAAGAAGEQRIAAAIAPLSAEGWHLLHDREDPQGGNIDHIVVGPGSIIVIDTKAWNGDITVKNGVLRNNGWGQQKVINRLNAQRDSIRQVLGVDGPIDTALVFATQPDLEPMQAGETVVLGVNFLLEAIRSTRTSYSNEQVEHMSARLIEAFPIAGSTPSRPKGMKEAEAGEIGDLFDRANRFFYLSPWQNYGNHRVYMRDADGEEYGYKDLNTGELHLVVEGDALAEAVLRSAQARGLSGSVKDIPKLPIEYFGGRMLSLFGKVNMSAFVGYEWKRGDKRYLYGTLMNPHDGFIELGHIDLATGLVKPKISGPVARDRKHADHYLALLRDRMPRND